MHFIALFLYSCVWFYLCLFLFDPVVLIPVRVWIMRQQDMLRTLTMLQTRCWELVFDEHLLASPSDDDSVVS